MPICLTFIDKSTVTIPFPIMDMEDMVPVKDDDSHLLNIKRYAVDYSSIKGFCTVKILERHTEDDEHEYISVRASSDLRLTRNQSEPYEYNGKIYSIKDPSFSTIHFSTIETMTRKLENQMGMVLIAHALDQPNVDHVAMDLDGQANIITTDGKSHGLSQSDMETIEKSLKQLCMAVRREDVFSMVGNMALQTKKPAPVADSELSKFEAITKDNFCDLASKLVGEKWVTQWRSHVMLKEARKQLKGMSL